NELNRLTGGQDRISGASRALEDGSWWTFGVDNLFYVARDPFEQRLEAQSVPLPLDNRNISKGFENISLVGDRYMVGSNGGYIMFSLPLDNLPSRELFLNAVKTSTKRDDFSFQPLGNSTLELESQTNYLEFVYSVPNYQALS